MHVTMKMLHRGLFLILALAAGLMMSVQNACAADEAVLRGIQRGCIFAYYPSLNEVWVSCDFTRKVVRRQEAADLGRRCTSVTVSIVPKGKDNVLASADVPVTDGKSREARISVPKLEGEYVIRFTLKGGDEPLTVTREFERKLFPWEGNTLGISNEVPPPFSPVKTSGNQVDVVFRQYQMNGFGLWDKVVTRDRDILAGPMRLRYQTAKGEGAWDKLTVKNEKSTALSAVYAAEAQSAAVIAKTNSTIEVDGCMKVEMTLLPGANPQEITKLWIDIPLKDNEVPLFISLIDGNRTNLPGATPAGSGVVWDSTKARRSGGWQNSFTPYLWLGAEERGLAWFAENDKGWVTEKKNSKLPLQDLVREGNTLSLRIYLVNVPTTIRTPHQIVFGLQASPTKPMPENWRANGPSIPSMSGPVNPWGGIGCASKGPYKDDWTVVDKIIEAQKTGKVDKAWFEEFAKKNDPPMVHGRVNWLERTLHFTTRRERPILVYAEEMRGYHLLAEWLTFQDDWGVSPFTQREWETEANLRKGFDCSPSSNVNFTTSYQEFSLWFHNEWLKRGIGLYWDNTYPSISTNTRMTAAYRTEDGAIQPAMALWNQREYMKRTWNLLQLWRRQHPEDKLEWSNHMTTTLLLPLHTWGTTTLDFEFQSEKPLDVNMIRAETMGRQVGCYPHSHYQLSGHGNPIMAKLNKEDKAQAEQIEWAMRLVHEVIHGKGPEFDFGYGTDAVQVHNYWTEPMALTVDNPQVKWIALSKPASGEAMLVLVSWSEKDTPVTVTIQRKTLGLAPTAAVTDYASGAPVAFSKPDTIQMTLPAPYGVRVLRVK